MQASGYADEIAIVDTSLEALQVLVTSCKSGARQYPNIGMHLKLEYHLSTLCQALHGPVPLTRRGEALVGVDEARYLELYIHSKTGLQARVFEIYRRLYSAYLSFLLSFLFVVWNWSLPTLCFSCSPQRKVVFIQPTNQNLNCSLYNTGH